MDIPKKVESPLPFYLREFPFLIYSIPLSCNIENWLLFQSQPRFAFSYHYILDFIFMDCPPLFFWLCLLSSNDSQPTLQFMWQFWLLDLSMCSLRASPCALILWETLINSVWDTSHKRQFKNIYFPLFSLSSEKSFILFLSWGDWFWTSLNSRSRATSWGKKNDRDIFKKCLGFIFWFIQ